MLVFNGPLTVNYAGRGIASGWSVMRLPSGFQWSAFTPRATRSGTSGDRAEAERVAKVALGELKAGQL